jgi:hypothetical protein
MATPNDMPKYTPLPMPAGAPSTPVSTMGAATAPMPGASVADMNASDSAKSLFVDPTPAFQPVIDFLGEQRTRANDRYAQNKADIANIFGNLTQVNKESQDRVRQQFESSITNQQMATAERMAQARMGAEQTQASAIRAMDERGGGPMGNLMASPAAVASERAIGDMGSFAQIWEGQQRAIQEQSQQDLQAGLRGLGFMEADSNRQLQRSLEDTLNQLSGQEVGVRSELAQAIVGGRSQVAQANYNEVLAERAAAEARRLAAVRGMYDVEQAGIKAAADVEKARLNAQNRVVNYPSNSAGVTQFMRNEGADDAQIGRFWAGIDSTAIDGVPNSQAAFSAWMQSNTVTAPKGRTIRPTPAQQAAARLYFDGLRYDRQDSGSIMGELNFGAPNTSSNPRSRIGPNN